MQRPVQQRPTQQRPAPQRPTQQRPAQQRQTGHFAPVQPDAAQPTVTQPAVAQAPAAHVTSTQRPVQRPAQQSRPAQPHQSHQPQHPAERQLQSRPAQQPVRRPAQPQHAQQHPQEPGQAQDAAMPRTSGLYQELRPRPVPQPSTATGMTPVAAPLPVAPEAAPEVLVDIPGPDQPALQTSALDLPRTDGKSKRHALPSLRRKKDDLYERSFRLCVRCGEHVYVLAASCKHCDAA